jgi:phosphopantothenoylcysteine decarboxylase / phosphopantothenate---cysteine ligase
MNTQMWQAPSTQRNIQTLQQDGVTIFGPANGSQACGETGEGRMLEPYDLLTQLSQQFQSPLLKGKRLLITAGATYEPIDPVRGITNLSSGKMGIALADVAVSMGAEVTLIKGLCQVLPLSSVHQMHIISATSAESMLTAVTDNISGQDVFISVAAVADWRPTVVANQKLKKTIGAPSLEFVANPDILANVASLPKTPFCVGFAAETEQLIEHGKAKLTKKNIPMLVVNHATTTFGSDENQATIISHEGNEELPKQSKYALAQYLLNTIAQKITVPSSYIQNIL